MVAPTNIKTTKSLASLVQLDISASLVQLTRLFAQSVTSVCNNRQKLLLAPWVRTCLILVQLQVAWLALPVTLALQQV
jgi:hypothetical protein